MARSSGDSHPDTEDAEGKNNRIVIYAGYGSWGLSLNIKQLHLRTHARRLPGRDRMNPATSKAKCLHLLHYN